MLLVRGGILMKDFEGKIIKINLNSTSGWITITAPYIKAENDFIVVKNTLSKR